MLQEDQQYINLHKVVENNATSVQTKATFGAKDCTFPYTNGQNILIVGNAEFQDPVSKYPAKLSAKNAAVRITAIERTADGSLQLKFDPPLPGLVRYQNKAGIVNGQSYRNCVALPITASWTPPQPSRQHPQRWLAGYIGEMLQTIQNPTFAGSWEDGQRHGKVRPTSTLPT